MHGCGGDSACVRDRVVIGWHSYTQHSCLHAFLADGAQSPSAALTSSIFVLDCFVIVYAEVLIRIHGAVRACFRVPHSLAAEACVSHRP